MKKTLLLTAFLTVFAASYAFSVTLVDVPSGHWAEDAVQKLIDSGLIEGYPDKTFKGDRPLTRYEYAMVVNRMVDLLDKSYCKKGDKDCSPAAMAGVTEKQLDELKGIVEKLAAEFKDELAALKVKVDENTKQIGEIKTKLENTFFNVDISGSVRQRIDVPNSDLQPGVLAFNFLGQMYDPANTSAQAQATAVLNLDTGYQMRPYLQLDGDAGERVDFSIGLKQYFSNTTPVGVAPMAAGDDDLEVDHAYVDLDFSKDVRELDLFTVRSGYQYINYGPYSMLVDTYGNGAMPGITLGIGKDRVKVSASGLLNTSGTNASTIGLGSGFGTTGKDLYYSTRLDVDLDEVRLGVNFLGNGVLKEQAWGADVDADILTHSSFLTGIRGEYLTIMDTTAGAAPAATADDYSFTVGVDVYETKRSLVTVGYADTPATTVNTSLDANPFTEYDGLCALGIDTGGTAGGMCHTYASGRMLFPMGFKGLGLEASHIVLGDVKLAAKAIVGDFAGGTIGGTVYTTTAAADLEGADYPGYAALSITKPINDQSAFRVEYMQQGLDPVLMNRIRSELLINF